MKVIEPEELAARTGYSRPHTAHCGPDGIYLNAIGAPDGGGPGGIFVLDHDTFDVRGPWEADRGSQYLAYDFWWHLGHDTMITSEWGTPNMVEDGINPELLLAGQYGHRLHVWNLRTRKHLQALDLGPEQQMVLELRPSHDPNQTYGFAGVVVSLKDLSSSIWAWYREGGPVGGAEGDRDPRRAGRPGAAPAGPEALRGRPAPGQRHQPVPGRPLPVRLLLGHRGVPPVRRLRPLQPPPDRLGAPGGDRGAGATPARGQSQRGPQMVELSRDGQRVYVSNSLYASWDAQFYPEGIRGWVAKLDALPGGGLEVDGDFLVQFQGERPHQVRLEGGDASSNSYCFP